MSLSIPWSTSPWPLLQGAAEQGAVVVVPLGATEQHGPHLPVETDSLIAAGMATRAAELAGVPVVVGPTIPFGYSHYHLHLAGTVSLRRETLAGLLLDVCRSIHAHGFERLLLLNAHGGNAPGMESAVTELAEEESSSPQRPGGHSPEICWRTFSKVPPAARTTRASSRPP